MTDKRRLPQTRQGEAKNCHRLKKTPKAQQLSEEKGILEGTLVKMSIVCSLVNSVNPCFFPSLTDHALIMQDADARGSWVKGIQELSVLFSQLF